MLHADDLGTVGMMDVRQICAFLFGRRRAVGWTQEELAERSGVSVRTIRNLETGANTNPRRTSIDLLLQAFGTSLSALAESGPNAGGAGAVRLWIPAQRDRPSERTGSVDPARWRGVRAPLDEFVGRGADLRHVVDTVRRSRLLVLTGPGGVGKTRLALAAATALQPLFAEGVAVVDLSHCPAERHGTAQAVEAVRAAVLRAVGPGAPGAGETEGRRLVVLDTAEHVVTTVSRLTHELMGAFPAAHFVVTSRRPLTVPSADTWEVEPLAVHALDDGDVPAAVELFLRRVGSGVPTLDLSGQLPLVAALCERLDGLPLSIELAARRVRSVPVEMLVSTESSLEMLDGIDTSGLSRHRTLTDSVRWSVELLSAEQQLLLRRLALRQKVYTAEDVLLGHSAGDDTERGRIVGLLGELTDASLVRIRRGIRYEYESYSVVREYLGAPEGPACLRPDELLSPA
ncbi:helix-turn-helix domain-containing protein [Streptomyces sp. NBC_01261]|uniref:helix-turn-helix domain-containing protein n=1 Tax=Streptomyces sp. NBC_01261 TaxID=2903802 RepID=UPI002E369C9D|nr:helix-turn-helix domain-containing protein [Streptomyces sp. NBC_01261]